MNWFSEEFQLPELVRRLKEDRETPLGQEFLGHKALQAASTAFLDEPKSDERDSEIVLKDTPLEGNEQLLKHTSIRLTSDEPVFGENYTVSSLIINFNNLPESQ